MSSYGYITPPPETRESHRVELPYVPDAEVRLLPASGVVLALTALMSIIVLVTMEPFGFGASEPPTEIIWDTPASVAGLPFEIDVAITAPPRVEPPQHAAIGAPPQIENEPATTYTVVSGDTMAKIAGLLGVSLPSLIEENGIDDPALIEVGQVLRVPTS